MKELRPRVCPHGLRVNAVYVQLFIIYSNGVSDRSFTASKAMSAGTSMLAIHCTFISLMKMGTIPALSSATTMLPANSFNLSYRLINGLLPNPLLRAISASRDAQFHQVLTLTTLKLRGKLKLSGRFLNTRNFSPGFAINPRFPASCRIFCKIRVEILSFPHLLFRHNSCIDLR